MINSIFLNRLHRLPLDLLWKEFLIVQTNLFFPHEKELLSQHVFFSAAESILEIGSGYGFFLMKLAQTFPEKTFTGMDRDRARIDLSQSFSNLHFFHLDAEEEQSQFFHRFDLVIFRLTLQYLRDPLRAFSIATRYLKPNGHFFIIEAYEPVKSAFPPLPAFDEALDRLNQLPSIQRTISLTLLQKIVDPADSFHPDYSVVFTNLNPDGTLFSPKLMMEVKSESQLNLYSQFHFLLLMLIHRHFGIAVDFFRAKEEFNTLLSTSGCFIRPGRHELITKKRTSWI